MNILLTTAGRRSYIVDYFKQCEGIGKVYASNSVYSIALQRADGYLITPLIYDKGYIPALIDFCKQNDVHAVLSLLDMDLLVLAKNRRAFEEANVRLILGSTEFVEICNDKWKTYQFLRDNNLPTPKTYINLQMVEDALNRGEVTFPIIMKPRWGMASMSIYKVENMEELRVLTKKCEREIFASLLKYESNLTKDAPIIYQEVICGDEFGIDVLNDLDGNYIKTFAKQKVTMRSGETDLGLTTNSEPFEKYAKRISELGRHEGLLSLDCIKNERGLFFIEFNCRISGHYPLSYLAGFNYPQIIVDWMNGKELNVNNIQFKENLYIVKDLVPTILDYNKQNAIKNTNMKHLVIIGARRFCRAVYDLAISMPTYQKEFDVKGFLDDNLEALNGYENYPPVLSSVEAYEIQPDDVFVCALSDVTYKKHYTEMILNKGGEFMTIIHPSVHLGTNVIVGSGCIIAGNVWLDSDTHVDDYVIIQTGTLIGHDCHIDKWSTIDSLCFLGGYVHVEESVIIHPHSSIIPHKTVHSKAVVNIASVVIRDVTENTTVMGNPAKKIEY